MTPLLFVLATVLALGDRTPAAQELSDMFAYRAQDLAALRKGFAQPLPEARPWVYWFW